MGQIRPLTHRRKKLWNFSARASHVQVSFRVRSSTIRYSKAMAACTRPSPKISPPPPPQDFDHLVHIGGATRLLELWLKLGLGQRGKIARIDVWLLFFFFFCHHRLLWHKGEGRRGTWLVIKATQQSSRLQFLAFVACGYCLYEIRV